MKYDKRKHNAPISKVIKDYVDKDSGKVSSSRKEIEWRFNALDWRYQKQILFAFLQSGKSDREWAYKKLYAVWDDCFIPVLQDLWEQYHEKQLAWLIISFFPIDYLKKEFESLSEGRNYYFLFRRLRDDRDFVLDRSRLNEADLLAVRTKLGEVITDDEVFDLFFLLIYKLCKGVYKFRTWRISDDDEGHPLLTIFDHPMIKTMFIVIDSGLERPSLVKKIREWMYYVTDCFIKEHGDMDMWFISGKIDYVRQMIKEHCLKYIAPEFKNDWDTFDPKDQQRFLDYLDNRHKEHMLKESSKNENTDLDYFLFDNHSVRDLINNFSLEIVDP